MSAQEVEDFFADVSEEMIREIMVGTGLDVHKFIDVGVAKTAAIHCVLNGPVGVNKTTTFPGITRELKIKELYNGRLSNKMWRNFCTVVAENLVRKHPDLVRASQQFALLNNVWPLNE
jgi:hypothetical protein